MLSLLESYKGMCSTKIPDSQEAGSYRRSTKKLRNKRISQDDKKKSLKKQPDLNRDS